MRLDKFLVENGLGSRSQVKEVLKKGLIFSRKWSGLTRSGQAAPKERAGFGQWQSGKISQDSD